MSRNRDLPGPELADAINEVTKVTGLHGEGDWFLWIPGDDRDRYPAGTSAGDKIQAKLRNGHSTNGKVRDYRWNNYGHPSDIVAWRVV